MPRERLNRSSRHNAWQHARFARRGQRVGIQPDTCRPPQLTIAPQQGQAFTLPGRNGKFLHQVFQASMRTARMQAQAFTALPHAKRDDRGFQYSTLQARSNHSIQLHGHPCSRHVQPRFATPMHRCRPGRRCWHEGYAAPIANQADRSQFETNASIMSRLNELTQCLVQAPCAGHGLPLVFDEVAQQIPCTWKRQCAQHGAIESLTRNGIGSIEARQIIEQSSSVSLQCSGTRESCRGAGKVQFH